MDMKIIFAPIIGAGIGYSTNWLAIKMLFRPYTEKRVLGIRLPFTPGLIPKERERVAKSIGEVIQDYLLTDKIIVNELLEDSTKDHVLELINHNLYNQEGNIDLEQLLLSNDNKPVLNKLKDILVIRLYDLIQDKNMKEQLQKAISKKISISLKKVKLTDIVSEEELNYKYEDIINNQKTKALLTNFLSGIIKEEATINEIIDEEMINNVKRFFINYIDTLTSDLLIFENEKLKEKVVGLIDATIKEKVGALGAMFVNGESVYHTIAEKSKEKLQEQEVKDEIYTFIIEKIDEVTNRPLGEILSIDTRESLITWLADYIPRNLSKLDITSAIDLKDNDLYSLINNLVNDSLEERIKHIVNSNYEEMLGNKDIIKNIEGIVDTLLNKVLLTNIKVSDEDRKDIDTFILDKYSSFVNKHITKLIRDVKLSSIIEKQLNMFDIKMLEDIILSIARKELNAITLLGGLLGFIISFLAVLL
ncbi:DUF445 family protein [Vallitalea sp.]|jgi:uncharacterized membrane protein YheB (UPF0754 family)|uniref:DUF445 family protein n=1 Tax=Vallitalea sp. TaxID=1882829 RepID=UPI0025F46D6B|nr:DUF445 family protein [Vallitalea sp.]MCT4686821.1 DUF445 family protein [Vallitalea sp.]